MYQKLIEELEDRGKTRYWLAHAADIYLPDIYSALAGKKPLFPAWKRRIAKALDMTVEELFPEGGEKE